MSNTKWWIRTLSGSAIGLSVVLATLLVAQFSMNSPFSTGLGSQSPPSPGAATHGTVQSVIDGDTLVLSIAGQSERVRLVGIDTPETVATNTPKQCFGAEASQALKGLVAPGDVVSIAADTERRDRYGRLLLYLHTSDGVFVNQWLVESGFAEIMFFEPNTTMRQVFTASRNKARSGDIGLWGRCDGPDQPLS